MKKILFLLILGSSLLPAAASFAGSATGTLNVTAEVVAACTVGSSSIAFGDYLGLEVQAEGSISLNCASGKTVDIEILGYNDTGRSMHGGTGSNSLTYNLYTTSARDYPWGTGSESVSYTGIGADDTVPVYGTIYANQSVAEGSYSDTLTITVSW